ncbi:MAG: ribonuclease III domain-containing protein [Anaerovorax sp.]
MEKENLEYANSTVLAYIGDAVYEVYVREQIMNGGEIHADKMHSSAIKYVRAEGQAMALKKMFHQLSDKEQALVKRARNKKITSKPKNADPILYKWATGLEALIGYLHLSGQKERMEEIIIEIMKMIDGEENGRKTEEK